MALDDSELTHLLIPTGMSLVVANLMCLVNIYVFFLKKYLSAQQNLELM